MNLALAVLTPFIGAPLVAWISRHGRASAAWGASGVTAFAGLWLAPLLSPTFEGTTTDRKSVV